MKISELKVKGYRSLKDVAWRPGDLNVLIGPNGGGKSNLLRVLQLLQAAADGGLAKWVQREGGMIPMMWDGDVRRMEFWLTAQEPSPMDGSKPYSAEYFVFLDRLNQPGAFAVPMESLRTMEQGARAGSKGVQILGRSEKEGGVFDSRGHQHVLGESELPAQETVLARYGEAFQTDPVVRKFRKFLVELSAHTEFHTGHASEVRRSAVARHETRMEANGENLISVLHTLYTESRGFRQDMDDAMSAAFGGDFGELLFPPEADQHIQFRVRWKSMERAQSAADLSDGTIRFLHLLAILANPEPPSLIAIDEPETGLHPVMQHIIAEFAVDAASRTQVVLTTHSPEFLDCFEDTVPTTTVVEWQEGHGTTVRNLSGEALADWVKHFSLGEILRTNAASAMETEGEE